MSYKYDPATGEAMYDPATGDPIPDTVLAVPRIDSAKQDNTKVPARPAKPQQNLETLSNARAALAGFQPTTMSMLFPRLDAMSDVDTARYDQPGLPQHIGAVAKDLLSLPGRTVLGGAVGLTGLTSVPGGEGSTLDRATRHMASEAGRSMSAATNLDNDPGLGGFLETAGKDPLNALFPAVSAAGSVGRKAVRFLAPKTAAAAAEKLKALKPILTGAAGTEDAAQAADKLRVEQANELLRQRAAAGTKDAQAKLDAAYAPGEGVEYIDEGVTPTAGEALSLDDVESPGTFAREGYVSAAGRGAAEEVDPLRDKILSAAYDPQTFRMMSPDWAAQKLGQARNYADATGVESPIKRRLAGFGIEAGLPTLDAAVRGGAPLVGYSAADAALSGDDREINPLTNLGAGTALRLGGQLLKYKGTQSFPGAEPAVSTNRGPSRTVRQTVQQNMDELIGHNMLPTLTQKGYLRETEKTLKKLGPKYNESKSSVLASENASPEEILEAAKVKLGEYSNYGRDVYYGQPRLREQELPGMPDEAPKFDRDFNPSIQRVLDDAEQRMVGNQHIYASPTGLSDPTSIQGRGRDAVRARAEAKQALKEYQTNVQSQLDNPTIPANKVLDLHTVFNDPKIWQDPAGDIANYKKLAYQALYDATGDVSKGFKTIDGRTYGEVLKDLDLDRQYGLWSSFDDVLRSSREGLQSRVSTTLPLLGQYIGNAAISHYAAPSMAYYGGRVANRALGAGHALAQDINDTTGAR